MNGNSAEPAERLLTVPETEEEPSITNISAQFQTLSKAKLAATEKPEAPGGKAPRSKLS